MPKQLPAMRLYFLRDLPTVDVPYGQVVEGAPNPPVTLPNLVALIDHPKGLVMVDSGYGSRFSEVKSVFPLNLLYLLIQVGKIPPYQLVRDRLQTLGIAPDRVRDLVLTHLHPDHMGGVVDVPAAEVVVSHSEWLSAQDDPTIPGFLKERIRSHHREVDLSAGAPYETFEHGVDLYGDGAIVLVATPGHSRGHMSVFVNLPSGRRFCLAGDVAWVRENYQKPIHKGWPMRALMEPTWDEDALRRLHELSRLAPEITIVPAHDPDSDRTLLQPPAYYQ